MLKQVQHDIKRVAFTLAEVLITLTVIGVVAAITMPTLIQNKNNNEIKARVKKSYATLANAFELAKANNGDFESWNWASGDANKILDIVAPNLNIKEKCGTDVGCFPDVYYKQLNDLSDTNYYIHPTAAKARLADGSSLAIRSLSSCSESDDVRNDICGYIDIDINGDASPNKWGNDMFAFDITKQGIVPFKRDGSCTDLGDIGYGCATNIIYADNINYLTLESTEESTEDPCY